MMQSISYRIYAVDALRAGLVDNERLIVGNMGQLHYGLVFNPCWTVVKGLDHTTAHLRFFALSSGWQRFTSTGFSSRFLSLSAGFLATDHEVIDYFKMVLSDADFDDRGGVQLDLFE